MNFFLRIAAYIFHPLFIPLLGAIVYYKITPRYVEHEIVAAKLTAIIIITLLIPIISFFFLKNLNLIKSIHLPAVKERKYPLMIQSLLLLLILKKVYSPYDSIEMYYFFIGILISSLTALILVFFNFKVSLHQMGISGITMFIIALSLYFQINLLIGIGFFLFCNGWVASSRLHTESHTITEIIVGFIVGILPQLMVVNFWL